MDAKLYTSIQQIQAESWNALWPSDYPFTQHGFFSALEDSACIDTSTTPKDRSSGWHTQHLVIEHDQQLLAAMPLFLKQHSYGEYVFDWSWADAYHHAGLDYYPKIVNAIPFTPSTGPRVGFSPSLNAQTQKACAEQLLTALQGLIRTHNCSGFHGLFPNADNAAFFNNAGMMRRIGYQFHWFNQGYKDFDDFLTSFSSRKRKNIKKERQKITTTDVSIKMRCAADISTQEWDHFYHLYQRTYLKRSGHTGYLNRDFFHRMANAFPQQVLLASAHQNDTMIAAAFYLRDNTTLYGRYWGTLADIDGLHFECCYYQGIDYAIAHQLQRFDPGAQGEHKIQRGFTPVKTQSFHTITDARFAQAIGEFLEKEGEQVHAYIQEARTYLPFKDGEPIVSADILCTETPITP